MNSIERAMERARKRAASPGAEPGREAPVEHLSLHAHAAEPLPRPRVELDLAALDARGFLTPAEDKRELQEQYRMVKRPLLGHAFAVDTPHPNPANLVQITSSVADEGKTFTAFNLGMSIAMEQDFTVLLVDTDLTRRSLTLLAGLGQAKGISDVLAGDVDDVGTVIHRTNVAGLGIVPAGGHHPRASELMASEAMRRVTTELAGRYRDRVLLFDSPPLLMDSQAATLSAHMGQVLVVVEAGRTSEKLLREGLELVDRSRSRVGLLLNKSPRGYGRGYGYHGGYA